MAEHLDALSCLQREGSGDVECLGHRNASSSHGECRGENLTGEFTMVTCCSSNCIGEHKMNVSLAINVHKKTIVLRRSLVDSHHYLQDILVGYRRVE